MNKSLLALLLVCAIAGMACASPYREVEEQDDDENEQAIQLLRAIKTMEELEEKVNKQGVSKKAKAQLLGTLGSYVLSRCISG